MIVYQKNRTIQSTILKQSMWVGHLETLKEFLLLQWQYDLKLLSISDSESIGNAFSKNTYMGICF